MTRRHTLNARRLLALLAAAVMGITAALSSAVPSAATVAVAQAGRCPGLSRYASNPGTFYANHHPVILVHGWDGTSNSMWPVEQGLRKLMPDTFDFRYFDYRGNRGDWAARAPVASCLADYINNISALQHDAGGDGKVYVVAHSMGGLAIRFATDKNTVPNPVTASALGGVVTIDTPHLGSVFGSTWTATLTQWWQEHHGQSLQPDHTSDAARCLAIHGPGTHLPSGCATPPYLPAGVPLAETAGTSTVRRTLFGIDLYDIPVPSDGVVSVDSAHGYLTSGVEGTKPPHAAAYLPTTSCTITSDQALTRLLAAVHGEGLPAGIIGAVTKAFELTDTSVLDAINASRLTPDVEALLGTALLFPCGHDAMLTNETTLADVATALRADFAAHKPVPAGNLPAHLSTDGYGPLQFGMTLAEAQAALGSAIDTQEGGTIGCLTGTSTVAPNVIFVVVNGRVLAAGTGNGVDQTVTTASGLHIGSSLADLKADVSGLTSRPYVSAAGYTEYSLKAASGRAAAFMVDDRTQRITGFLFGDPSWVIGVESVCL